MCMYMWLFMLFLHLHTDTHTCIYLYEYLFMYLFYLFSELVSYSSLCVCASACTHMRMFPQNKALEAGIQPFPRRNDPVSTI